MRQVTIIAIAAGATFAVSAAQAAPAGDLKISIAPYAERAALRIPGVAKTSVDRRFGPAAVGEAGFLCGLQPGPQKTGAAGASGYDPQGRFLGAKLSFHF